MSPDQLKEGIIRVIHENDNQEVTGDIMQSVLLDMVDTFTPSIEGFPPYIGEDGFWYVFDIDAGEYVSSGIPAQGPKGDPGSGAENAVQFIPQSLTPAQQAQARENIGAGAGMINVSGWAGTFQLQLNEVNNYLPITTALSVGDNIMINGYITNWGGITTAFSSVIPMLAAGVVEGWYLYNDTPNGNTVELDDPLQAIAGRLTIRTYGISNETRITGIYLMPKALQT